MSFLGRNAAPKFFELFRFQGSRRLLFFRAPAALTPPLLSVVFGFSFLYATSHLRHGGIRLGGVLVRPTGWGGFLFFFKVLTCPTGLGGFLFFLSTGSPNGSGRGLVFLKYWFTQRVWEGAGFCFEYWFAQRVWRNLFFKRFTQRV